MRNEEMDRVALELAGDVMQRNGLERLSPEDRSIFLTEIQDFVGDSVTEYPSRQRLTFVYEPAQSTRRLIQEFLSVAAAHGKEGPVAEYIVGAKLQLRFPDIEVRNVSFSTADTQLGEPGDFYIRDTVFHVTVAPMNPVYDKCKANLDQGLRVYLLVPDGKVAGTRQNVEGIIPGRVGVESIESFVAQNLDELGTFSNMGLRQELLKLFEMYNRRVNEVESDKSMLIEIPPNLL